MKIINNIDQTIFREYDLRGIYGKEITEDVAYTIGKSYGTYIKKENNKKAIIGYDNRESSPILSNALIKGITESGVDVINIGLVTTPMYYFARYHYQINTGIMITASHNPKEYNGFKMAFSEIGNAYGQLITDFRDFTNKCEFDSGQGNVEERDIRNDYIDLIKNSIDFGDKPIKAVVDCGNGTGSIIVKDVMDALNIEYYPLYCESDSNFPNHHPDPSVHKNMVDLGKKVIELGYNLGIGIDGDADRIGIVDEKGNIIGADLYMLIVYRNIASKMRNKKALFDVKCSKTLIDELDKLNIEKVMYRTGNSYMNMMMQEGDFDFGGEYAGHIYFRDKFPGFDDGIYAGLRLIEILSKTDRPLSSLLEGINTYYSTEELKFKVTDESKFDIVEKVKQYCINKGYSFIDIDGVRVEFEDGWVLIRVSNTGPNLTSRFEANSKERLDELQTEFVNLLNTLI
jgi:phosphomannomutase/phosphoglucomutase